RDDESRAVRPGHPAGGADAAAAARAPPGGGGEARRLNWHAIRVQVLVVGAGVAGLTAARDLHDAGHDVVVIEGADRAGGKLRRRAVAGVVVDVGAEAMLSR